MFYGCILPIPGEVVGTGDSFHILEYVGEGCLVLEPTYKYIILQDVSKWGAVGMTIGDGMFLACDARVKRNVIARKNVFPLY